ncbi:MAG: hypothetical protein JWO38_217 [Gemmataceae bacterium]|nr:hypothetical protein [Gemmataceae bacterium]
MLIHRTDSGGIPGYLRSHPDPFSGTPRMTHPDLPVSESYPTFWAAIPVDSAASPDPHPPSLADQPDNASVGFRAGTEDEPIPVTLFVEQTDVG